MKPIWFLFLLPAVLLLPKYAVATLVECSKHNIVVYACSFPRLMKPTIKCKYRTPRPSKVSTQLVFDCFLASISLISAAIFLLCDPPMAACCSAASSSAALSSSVASTSTAFSAYFNANSRSLFYPNIPQAGHCSRLLPLTWSLGGYFHPSEPDTLERAVKSSLEAND